MSTEHQRYSTANQADAIAKYARRRRLDVVKTYSDEGVSGLSLKNRPALKALLAEAMSGAPGYEVILVYDVSRWGRFQNPDQSAHYEFLCTEAGVPVEYCAELFENDGSLASTLLKGLKRAMAAEFSRDLSVKVAAGKARLAGKGYWQNGRPGLGLRRRTIDPKGALGPILEAGEHKAIQGHRTILVPGPEAEVALVNRIFRLFVETGLHRNGIARLLNAEGLRTPHGSQWSFVTINALLSNPKYVGDLEFNRKSTRLGTREVTHSRSEWRVTPGAFEPIVERLLFEAAQDKLRRRRTLPTDAQMLDSLRALLGDHGTLTYRLIKHAPGLPAPATVLRRFGSWKAVYAALDYAGPKFARRCGVLSDDEMLVRLVKVLEVHGSLSAKLVDAAPDVPSYSTYEARFGSAQAVFAQLGHLRMTPSEQLSPTGQARLAAASALRAKAMARVKGGRNPLTGEPLSR
jgi:DNA invertase Pin-like site-specific DNA recombinase